MHSNMVMSFVAVAAVLAGCQSTQHIKEPLPPPKNVTPGSTFTVVKPFLVPSGDSSVYFQDTRLYPQGEIQSNYPYCQFVTGRANGAGEIIGEQTFTVVNVEYDEQGAGPKGMVGSVTDIHLQAASSDQAYRLNCLLPFPSQAAIFITPVEIQGVVGGYMELKVAP